MAIDSETVTLLAELGFLAADHSMTSQADTIADGLAAMRPGTEQPHLVRAYGRLGARDVAGAEKILREGVLSANPESEAGKTLLGLALHLAGKGAERDNVLDEVISAGGSDHVIEIAQKLRGAPIST